LGTTANELTRAEAVSGHPRRQPPSKLSLLLVVLVACLLLFLDLDWLWTSWALRSKPPISPQSTCLMRDPVRHRSLEPNCSCDRHYGKESYPFATNSLGFRDENNPAGPTHRFTASSSRAERQFHRTHELLA